MALCVLSAYRADLVHRSVIRTPAVYASSQVDIRGIVGNMV